MPTKPNPKTDKTPNQKLLEKGLRFLGIRHRSSFEIKRYLSQKTKDSDLIDQVFTELENLNLIDDQAFTTWFIQSRLHQKPRGPHLIAYELKKKYAIPQELIQSCLSQISSETWITTALTILNKHSHQLQKLPTIKQKLKCRQLLFRKGFPGETSAYAIDEYLAKE